MIKYLGSNESLSGRLESSDPPVNTVKRSPNMTQHDTEALTRYTWELGLGAGEVREMSLVMVMVTDRLEEGEQHPPHIYN